jgi:hypothetical protein
MEKIYEVEKKKNTSKSFMSLSLASARTPRRPKIYLALVNIHKQESRQGLLNDPWPL